jgi:hypothetical protein
VLGYDAGTRLNDSFSTFNTAIGYGTLGNCQANGNNNTALGNQAGSGITTGNSNTCIGSGAGLAGGSGVDLTTGFNNTYIGRSAASSGANVNNETVIGAVTTGRGSNTTTIGGTSVYLDDYGSGSLSVVSGLITASSDIRVKTNITYLHPTGEIEKLLLIKPATFNRIDDAFKSYTGFIANNLMEVYPSSVDCKKYKYHFEKDSTGKPKLDENGEVIYKKDENGDPIPRYLSVDNTEILAHVVLAFQEQQAQITTLQAQVAALTQKVQQLVNK